MSITLTPRHAGSRFRPVSWSDLSQPGAPLLGWGIEERTAGTRRYIPRGYDGRVHPFPTRAEAQRVCDDLNAQAVKLLGEQP